VSASEVASYVFCAKAWHLEHVLAERPSTPSRQRRDEGAEQHSAHGARIARAHRRDATLLRTSLLLLLAAFVALVIGIALSAG
jgi:hypothetical protein